MAEVQFRGWSMRQVLLAMLLSFAALTAHAQRIQVPSAATALLFDSVEGKYISVPLRGEIGPARGEGTVLTLTVGDSVYDLSRTPNYRPSVTFQTPLGAEYVAAFDKFAAWSTTATTRGDVFEKELARVGGKRHVRFVFVAKAPREHYLEMYHCAIGICLRDLTVTVDAANAAKLREMVVKLAQGTLASDKLDDVYK